MVKKLLFLFLRWATQHVLIHDQSAVDVISILHKRHTIRHRS